MLNIHYTCIKPFKCNEVLRIVIREVRACIYIYIYIYIFIYII